MIFALNTASADEVAVGASSAQFATLIMVATNRYQYVANVASWIAQGANPTASAGAGSCYVPANVPVIVDGRLGTKLATIEDSSGGKASLTPLIP